MKKTISAIREARIYSRARRLIVENGWAGSWPELSQGRYCLVTALSHAFTLERPNVNMSYRSMPAATKAIRDVLNVPEGELSVWNDAQRSVGPVLEALDAAESLVWSES